jgi:16S rRNA (guanine966-N2)-methyltransferase
MGHDMRIVGGRLKGRTLVAPHHEGTRPTSDRVRESVFNILTHGLDGPPLEGSQVIDLFAGTGALGLEAVSRGASYALFVEDNADARGLIRRNIEAMGLQGVTRIFRRDATSLGPANSRDQYAYAFLDPPYGKKLGEAGLASLSAGGWLAPGAIVILEERAGIEVTLPPEFEALEHRTYGDTTVHFARLIQE